MEKRKAIKLNNYIIKVGMNLKELVKLIKIIMEEAFNSSV